MSLMAPASPPISISCLICPVLAVIWGLCLSLSVQRRQGSLYSLQGRWKKKKCAEGQLSLQPMEEAHCPFLQGPPPTSHTCHTSHTCSLSCHLTEPCFSSGPAVPGSDSRSRGAGAMKGDQEIPKVSSLFWVATEERQHLQTLHCETREGALLPLPRVAHSGSGTLWGSF